MRRVIIALAVAPPLLASGASLAQTASDAAACRPDHGPCSTNQAAAPAADPNARAFFDFIDEVIRRARQAEPPADAQNPAAPAAPAAPLDPQHSPNAGPADVAVTIPPLNPGRRQRGDAVRFVVSVRNDGPAPAYRVAVSSAVQNLRIANVAGPCGALPCQIRGIKSGSSEQLTIDAVIAAPGDFSLAVTAAAQTPDPHPENNRDKAGGTAEAATVSPPPPPPPPPQCPDARDSRCPPPPDPWFWEKVGLAAAGALAAGALAVRWRRQWWRRSLKVIPSIEPGGEAVAGPFALQAPPLEIRVLLEPGEAGPEGPMPILREVIDA